jgi:hypothetical protein
MRHHLLRAVPKGFQNIATDPDVQAYVAAVQAAENQALPDWAVLAYDEFVIGLKADNIWNGLYDIYIWRGMATSDGALVPLKGVALSNNGATLTFDRYQGLGKATAAGRLDMDATNQRWPQSSFLVAAWATGFGTGTDFPTWFDAGAYQGAGFSTLAVETSTKRIISYSRSSASTGVNSAANTFLPSLFVAGFRNNSTSMNVQVGTTVTNQGSRPSSAPTAVVPRLLMYAAHDPVGFLCVGEYVDSQLLRVRVGVLMARAEAETYIEAVEDADGEPLEAGVKTAYREFIAGCAADGILSAIKACCIMAGARTLDGALTPLVGAAPTNVGPFVSGDYNRKTGLAGNGSSKYLNSNRAHNADGQNNHHLSIYINTVATGAMSYIGAGTFGVGGESTAIYRNTSAPDRLDVRSRAVTQNAANPTATGFVGVNRQASGSFTARRANSSVTIATPSVAGAGSEAFAVFARNTSPVSLYSDARLSFYSIGESLNLALLDARVSTLMADIASAIP